MDAEDEDFDDFGDPGSDTNDFGEFEAEQNTWEETEQSTTENDTCFMNQQLHQAPLDVLFPLPSEMAHTSTEQTAFPSLKDLLPDGEEFRISGRQGKLSGTFAPVVQQQLHQAIQAHIQLVSSGLYFLPNQLRDDALLKTRTLHELIELKVSLGNSIQCYGMKFYESFSGILQEKLTQVDKEIFIRTENL